MGKVVRPKLADPITLIYHPPNLTVTDDDHDWESLSSLVGQVMAQMTGSPDCPAQSFLRRYHFEMFSTWNSAPLLCRRLGREPFKFFPQLRSSTVDHSLADPAPASTNLTRRRRSLKVLELGSGTGLVGLTASQILASILSSLSSMEAIDVEIILTELSPGEGCLSTLVVKALKLDWREPENSELARTGLAGAFDVVLGSDLVYEPEHAVWASEAVRYFLKSEAKNDESLSDAQTTGLGLPRGDPQPSFHLLLPLRPTFTKESEAVHRVFGGSDMNLLLDQTDQIPSTLPIHCCKWELSSTNDHVEKALQPSNSRPFKIIEYSKEEGVQFGQGCGEYQYLQITWAD
ncbi:hypothetical protein KEM48_004009 [Puccinia striiformis f. sp. tritici PST-130]|nr:hypothetical protein KEM48_004009 [Puccinia striiformis f. sp. tritici PST-130]